MAQPHTASLLQLCLSHRLSHRVGCPVNSERCEDSVAFGRHRKSRENEAELWARFRDRTRPVQDWACGCDSQSRSRKETWCLQQEQTGESGRGRNGGGRRARSRRALPAPGRAGTRGGHLIWPPGEASATWTRFLGLRNETTESCPLPVLGARCPKSRCWGRGTPGSSGKDSSSLPSVRGSPGQP